MLLDKVKEEELENYSGVVLYLQIALSNNPGRKICSKSNCVFTDHLSGFTKRLYTPFVPVEAVVNLKKTRAWSLVTAERVLRE